MTRQEAIKRINGMDDYLDFDELQEIYKSIIGELPKGITEFQLFSELCNELDITE